MNNIKIKKHIHELYNPSRNGYNSIGKWHYVYLNNKGKKISLIKIKVDGWQWEAYGFRMHYGRRFKTRKQAEKYIMERLSND